MDPGGTGRPTAWIVSSQHWPRAFIRGELLERGWEAEGFASAQAALAARGRPSVIVLDLFGLDCGAAELARLGGTGVPVVLLGGAAELARPEVRRARWEAVLQRPFRIQDAVEAVLRLDPRPPRPP
jgi:FixJ family two-component response regulator